MERTWTARGVSVVLVASAVLGCDLQKNLGKNGADDDGVTSAGADGLPQECVDYLAIYRCATIKSGNPNAESDVVGVRGGFKTIASNLGAAAAKKQCAELLAASQDGYAKAGCTKGVVVAAPAATPVATTTTAAATAPVPTPVAATAVPKASTTAAPKASASAKRPDKAESCSCGPGQVQFTSPDTVICAVLPCRAPGASCKKEDKTQGTCGELGTGEIGQRVRCGHLIQCM